MTESLEARTERIRLEKHIWASYRETYETELATIARTQAEAGGKLYVNGRVERRNTMHNVGVIWPRVFCYSATNTVLYGPLTIAVVKHLTGYNRRMIFTPPQDDRVYYAAPGGYPQTVNELIELVALCKKSDVEAVYRVGAHILIRSFYQTTLRTDPSLHDATMKAVLDPRIYNPAYFPACARSVDVDMEIDALPPRERGRRDGANGGYGLFAPASPFNVAEWGTYYVVHHSTGSVNRINGITMDYGGRIRIETVYVQLLVRALRPDYEQTRAISRYIQHFAYLVARPHLYEERIAEYNLRFPDAPYVECTELSYQVHRSTLVDNAANNFTSMDLSDHLIHNGIPIQVIHHCYAFGRQYLDQTFYNVGRVHESRTVNGERVDRLERFGVPPTLPGWAGWQAPSEETVRRLKYIHHSEGETNNLDNPFWIKFGADHAPAALIADPHTVPHSIPDWTGKDHSISRPLHDEDDNMVGNPNYAESATASAPESPLDELVDDEMDGEGEPDDESLPNRAEN